MAPQIRNSARIAKQKGRKPVSSASKVTVKNAIDAILKTSPAPSKTAVNIKGAFAASKGGPGPSAKLTLLKPAVATSTMSPPSPSPIPTDAVRIRIHGIDDTPTCQSLRPNQINGPGEFDEAKEFQCEACAYLPDEEGCPRVIQENSGGLDQNSFDQGARDLVARAQNISIDADLDIDQGLPGRLAVPTAHRILGQLVTGLFPLLYDKDVWLHVTDPNPDADDDDLFRRQQLKAFGSLRCRSLTIVSPLRSTDHVFQRTADRVEREVMSRLPSADLYDQYERLAGCRYISEQAAPYKELLPRLLRRTINRDLTGFITARQRITDDVDTKYQLWTTTNTNHDNVIQRIHDYLRSQPQSALTITSATN